MAFRVTPYVIIFFWLPYRKSFVLVYRSLFCSQKYNWTGYLCRRVHPESGWYVACCLSRTYFATELLPSRHTCIGCRNHIETTGTPWSVSSIVRTGRVFPAFQYRKRDLWCCMTRLYQKRACALPTMWSYCSNPPERLHCDNLRHAHPHIRLPSCVATNRRRLYLSWHSFHIWSIGIQC